MLSPIACEQAPTRPSIRRRTLAATHKLRKKRFIADLREKPDESSKHSNEFGSRIGPCNAGNIKAFAGTRPASEQPRAAKLACKQPPTGPSVARHHLKFLAHLVEGCLQAIFPEQTQRSSCVRKGPSGFSRKSAMNQKRATSKATGPSAARHHLKFLAHLVGGCLQAIFPEQTQRSSCVRKKSFRIFPDIRDEPKKGRCFRGGMKAAAKQDRRHVNAGNLRRNVFLYRCIVSAAYNAICNSPFRWSL